MLNDVCSLDEPCAPNMVCDSNVCKCDVDSAPYKDSCGTEF